MLNPYSVFQLKNIFSLCSVKGEQLLFHCKTLYCRITNKKLYLELERLLSVKQQYFCRVLMRSPKLASHDRQQLHCRSLSVCLSDTATFFVTVPLQNMSLNTCPRFPHAVLFPSFSTSPAILMSKLKYHL